MEKAFRDLPKEGAKERFEHIKYFANIGIEHIQGYTQYQRDNTMYYIFTHHTAGDYGYIMIANGMDCTKETVIRTPKGYNHPAGVQCVGQYLFVPCENKDGGSSILIYDLMNLTPMGTASYIENQHIKKINFTHRAGCLGVTDYQSNGKRYYIMAVGANEVYHVYRAEVDEEMLKKNFANISFNKVGSFSLKDVKIKELEDNGSTREEVRTIDCQGMGLATDGNDEAVYMVAPVLRGADDWVYLFRLNIGDSSVSATPILGRHMICCGGIIGHSGIHYRWGTGIRIRPQNKLVVLATARNCLPAWDADLDTNHWNH